jgi:acyl carrier protein
VAVLVLDDEGIPAMTDPIQAFIFASLKEMNYEVDDIDEDTQLGPRGADVGSLGLAELAIRVEDEYGVKIEEDESEEMAKLTVREFCAIVSARIGSGQATAGTPAE